MTMHPVFEKYRIEYLMERTGYSRRMLNAVKSGEYPAGRKFRRLVSLALGEPEEALFAPPGARGSQPEEAGDGAAR